MPQSGPGKNHRTGISLTEIFRMFPNDEAAERWFVEARWPDGPWCPHCGSANVQSGARHKSQPYRCRGCRKRFSVKTGTAMHDSKLGLQVWAIATYLMTTGLKGTASMKLHRDLGITQKTAWHLAHRLRETWQDDNDNGPDFPGPVEADETYVGGKLGNMSAKKRKEARQKPDLGKTIVVGVKDRASGAVSAKTVEYADKPTLQGFIADHAAPDAKVFTDDGRAYQGMDFDHETVNHSVAEYVRASSHQRDRILLVHVEARLPRHLSSHQREAYRPLRRRVRGAAQ